MAVFYEIALYGGTLFALLINMCINIINFPSEKVIILLTFHQKYLH